MPTDRPQPYHVVQSGTIHPLTRTDQLYDDLTADPRGVLWMWEPPGNRSSYVVGVDPSVGIVGWDRHNRVIDDVKTDNGCIEVIKVGHGEPGSPDFVPDVQVAEYAAPIDPEDLADVANIVGRVYGGADEEGQALCIVEVYPGPGLLTLRRMINIHGYTRHFIWKTLDSMSTRPTSYLGWTANQKSVRDLWIRTRRHILSGGLVHHSPWLVEEWTDCEMDFVKQTGQAVGGHDDRVRAVNLALWAAHEWSFDVETKTRDVEEGRTGQVAWQASDVTAEEMAKQWEDRFAELSD
jgi:hypothetical protein